MLTCSEYQKLLLSKDIDFLCGVPDSRLKSFLAYITDHSSKEKNIIAANEGNAIAIVAGYNLATGKIGMVYMQNSGLCNAINPLTSLTDKEVYSIPMLLMIGWRGEPGLKDEPQHVKLGRITESLLDSLEIPFSVLSGDIDEAGAELDKALSYMQNNSAPFAFLVRDGTFEKYVLKSKPETLFSLNRENALKLLVSQISPRDIVVSTTGMASRELFECREEFRQGHDSDFLTVGSMGHCSQIALGIALSKPERNVYCLDGDGSSIMHMGALSIIGSLNPANFKHIVFNNGAHDSVGGQPTVGFEIDIPSIAKASAYKNVFRAETAEEIVDIMDIVKGSKGPTLLEIRVNKGARPDLGRPSIPPIKNKLAFMNFLNDKK